MVAVTNWRPRSAGRSLVLLALTLALVWPARNDSPAADRPVAREGVGPRDGESPRRYGLKDGEGAVRPGPRDGEGAARSGSQDGDSPIRFGPREGAGMSRDGREGYVAQRSVTPESRARVSLPADFKPQTPREEQLFREIVDLQLEVIRLKAALKRQSSQRSEQTPRTTISRTSPSSRREGVQQQGEHEGAGGERRGPPEGAGRGRGGPRER